MPDVRRHSLIVFGLVVFLAAAVFWMTRREEQGPPAPDQPEDRPTSPAEADLFERRDLSLAQLENGELSAAAPLLEKLAAELPEDPFGPRNLMVGLTWGLREKKPPYQEKSGQAKGVAKGAAASEMVRAREGDSSVLHRLAARRARDTGDEKQALAEFAKAAELAPKDAGVRFEWYQAGRISADPASKAQAVEALEQAAVLSPDNLALLVEQMLVQADAKDPKTAATLARGIKLLTPFSAGIKLRTNFDMAKGLADARDAVGTEDWPTVLRMVRTVSNVLRPEVAVQLDQRRLIPHELEFALDDFSDATLAKLGDRGDGELPAIPVTFIPAEKPVAAKEGAIRQIAFADFDLDGTTDVIVLKPPRVEVHSRKGNEWTAIAGADVPAGARVLLAADLDRDHLEQPQPKPPAPGEKGDPAKEAEQCLNADVDLVVAGAEGVLVLKNRRDPSTGERRLDPVPQDDALGAVRDVIAAAVADLDHDGDLDLILSTGTGMSLWANRDNFTFMDISSRSSLPPREFHPTVLIPVDWNRNVDIDLILAGPDGPAGLLENNLHGRFRWKPFEGDEWKGFRNATGAVVLDADANASWDLAVSGPEGTFLALTSTAVAGVNRLKSVSRIDDGQKLDLQYLDYDNDGRLDLLGANASGEPVMLRGLARGTFERAAVLPKGAFPGLPADEKLLVRATDLDGDGDEDLVVASSAGDAGVAWLRNDGGNRNSWIDVRLSAEPVAQRPSERTNMHGLGSMLELKAGSRYQARVVAGQSTHFGLGNVAKPDVLRIVWTNGIPHNAIEPDGRRTLCAPQHLLGSCPYLYTWTGSKYEFFSDCLWAAPIGLQFGEGVIAPCREWEYLLIPGRRLVPVDREYRLQVTEELWEATYFDTIRLIAVDHPSDVAIYSNDKVGPPDLVQHKLHAVRHPRVPIAAHDDQGRDVLETIRADDGRYVRADRRLKQGLSEVHYLEFDLGELPAEAADSPRVTLFLTGWLFPTCTSLNVGMSQNPSIAPPKAPAIQIPDGNGGFKEAVGFIGFPGGKTKTIAAPLPASLFANGNTKLRLVTSMELAWDHVFFTVNEAPPEYRSTDLKLLQADLHERGYSKRSFPTANGPDWYDYADVSRGPLWPPMAGAFTRFGEVTELLNRQDDLQVVVGAGDEITLRFSADLEPPPDGWTRDFLIYNVGWDKDADLNTIYGQTVEPLPFVGMERYPYGATQSFPDTPAHRSYLENYQTRTQSEPAFWRSILRHGTR